MKRFLIKHDAVIGRTKEEGADLPPLELIFYTMVEAANLEAASDLATGYEDAGFKVKVGDIVEVGDSMSSDDLYTLLKQNDVLKVMY